jgi:hypothetical protein
MPNDESLESQRLQEAKPVSGDAEEWGRLFVKNLELEYASSASALPADATWPDFQQAMMIAIGKVFEESGATLESVARLWDEIAGRPSPIDEDVTWSREKNARRLNLIDKKIQQTITPAEALELTRLTQQMRTHCDREEMVPLEGARKIHRRLLDMADPKGTPT